MNREQILAILYEMAIVIGGETRVQPLVTKTLQRLLFHTSFPCGLVLLLPETEVSAGQPGANREMCLEVSIGDADLSPWHGTMMQVPAALWQGDAELLETSELLATIPCRRNYYRALLKLPIAGCGIIILLSPYYPDNSFPMVRLFQPLLGNFAKAIQLCRSNEAYTRRIIMERQTAESAFHDLSYRNMMILDSVGEGICGLDKDGNATFVNPAAAKMLGYSQEELFGASLHQMVHHKNQDEMLRPADDCPIMLTLHEGSRQQVTDDTFWRKDGTAFSVEYISTPLRSNDSLEGAVIVFQDITERHRLEREKEVLREQLLQSQKMEAIGQLAGGVAHDFNNILTVIMGFGNLIQITAADSEPLRGYIDQIIEASERAAHLTRSLLAFSRKQAMNPKPEKLHEIVRNVEKFLRRVIGENIQLETVLVEDSPLVNVDSNQIEQVLINLVANARDAIAGEGRIIISTGLIELDDSFIKNHGYGKAGEYLLLTVTDTGTGMDKETAARVFDPFFTTKEVGKGTGLGLAIVYGIVKQHNGYITVYSEPGQGTTFKVFLPVADSDTLAPVKSVPQFPQMGNATILLAEDEPSIRGLLSSTLRKFGYKVIEAEDGEDALNKFRNHQHTIDLLVFDVIMPKKNGVRTYEEICTLRPGIKILFLTGYTADYIRSKGLVDDKQELLMKPVLPTDMVRKIEEMLKD